MNLTAILLQVPVENTRNAAEEFKQMDPYGIAMTLIAMTVVFSVLIIIYLTFKYFSKLYNREYKKVKTEISDTGAEIKIEKNEVSAEVSAAIAMALHIYTNQQQDLESFMLTINRVSRLYSPWSSKIYTLRQLPR